MWKPCWICNEENCKLWKKEILRINNPDNGSSSKLLEPPIVNHIRERNATSSGTLKISILNVINHYCCLPNGMMKEEMISVNQSEQEKVRITNPCIIFIRSVNERIRKQYLVFNITFIIS